MILQTKFMKLTMDRDSGEIEFFQEDGSKHPTMEKIVYCASPLEILRSIPGSLLKWSCSPKEYVKFFDDYLWHLQKFLDDHNTVRELINKSIQEFIDREEL